VSRAPLVVVGDVLLDREVLGTVERLCPEAPVPVLDQSEMFDRPGGAGLAALFAASAVSGRGPVAGGEHIVPGRPAREVVLVGAISADESGDRIRELIGRSGVLLVEIPAPGPTPEKIRMRAGGSLLMRLDRGGAGGIGPVPAEAVSAIHAAGAILVSDYGRGVTADQRIRGALTDRAQGVPVVWDPHSRGGHPVAATRLVVPNRSEAAGFVTAKVGGAHSGEWPLATAPYGRPAQVRHPVAAHAAPAAGTAGSAGNFGNATNGNATNGNATNGNATNGNATNGNATTGNASTGNGHNGNDHNGNGHRDAATADLAQTAGLAVRLRRYWGAGAVAITLAERGAVLSDGVHPPLLVPTPFSARGDSCGAGDRFASMAIASLSEGSSVLDAVTAGVAAATAYVAAGGVLALCPEIHTRAEDKTKIGTTSGKLWP
jgi:D-beta-D-heptose 7-phosphate kinase/D-beta-D-heptose 1-phosphate adenosyltransferase